MKTKTLVILKPDCVRRKLMHECIKIFEQQDDMSILHMKYFNWTKRQLCEFYDEKAEFDWFKTYEKFMMSGPVLAIVLEGENIVSRVRRIIGSTDPQVADIGTIRGRFASCTESNFIHATSEEKLFDREFDIVFQSKNNL